MSSKSLERGPYSSDGTIKAVIFDCDGVILDSRTANAHFYNQFLLHFNKELLTEEQLDYVHSHTLQDSLEYLFQDEKLVQEARDLWDEMDYKPLIDLLTLQPGLLACLKQLRSRYRTAIATSRTRTMNQVMAKFGLNTYFELVVTSLDVLHPKPHPESLNKILSHFHLTPQEACYIGDSDVDRKTSQSAGVLFIAYNNEELEAAHHLSHFDELIPFLNQYNQLRE